VIRTHPHINSVVISYKPTFFPYGKIGYNNEVWEKQKLVNFSIFSVKELPSFA
jgi:hypothetical protein